jgi:hypothetical protein
MTWVQFLGYAAFSALGRVYQVVILDKILSSCEDLKSCTIKTNKQVVSGLCRLMQTGKQVAARHRNNSLWNEF